MVPNNMDALEWLRKQLESDGSDLLREMVASFATRLMAAEVDVVCNAGYGEVTPERNNSRNRYRHRALDTRVGTIDAAVHGELLALNGLEVDAALLTIAKLVARVAVLRGQLSRSQSRAAANLMAQEVEPLLETLDKQARLFEKVRAIRRQPQ